MPCMSRNVLAHCLTIAVLSCAAILSGCATHRDSADVSRMTESQAMSKFIAGQARPQLPPIPIDPALLEGEAADVSRVGYHATDVE